MSDPQNFLESCAVESLYFPFSKQILQIPLLRKSVHRYHLRNPPSSQNALLHRQPDLSLRRHQFSHCSRVLLAFRRRRKDIAVHLDSHLVDRLLSPSRRDHPFHFLSHSTYRKVSSVHNGSGNIISCGYGCHTCEFDLISHLIRYVIQNVHYRSPTTHTMPKWMKRLFVDFLPKYLLMTRPQPPGHHSKVSIISVTDLKTLMLFIFSPTESSTRELQHSA